MPGLAGHDEGERRSGLRAVVTLDDHEVDHRMRLPHLDVGLVFRRVVAGERGCIVRKFNDDVALAALTFGAFELAGTHDKACAELLEDRGVRQRIRLVTFVVVNVDARDPVSLRHSRFPSLYATSFGAISAWMASAAALGSAAPVMGRPTTR